MKTTDEIIQAAERVAKNRVRSMKLPRMERQRIESIIRTSYVDGYAEAIRDFKRYGFGVL